MQLVSNARTEAARTSPLDGAVPAPHQPMHLGLARARERLRAHVAAPMTLDALARVACLSKFYFLRAFTRAFEEFTGNNADQQDFVASETLARDCDRCSDRSASAPESCTRANSS